MPTFSHSWKKKCNLTKAQSDLGLPQHSLVGCCATLGISAQNDWSNYRARSLYSTSFTVDHKNAHLILTWQDLDVLEVAFGPLDVFTDMFIW